MNRVVLISFLILMTYLIVRMVVKAWKRSDLAEKARRAQEIEKDFQTVQGLEAQHPDIEKKNKKVLNFIKKGL